LSQGTDDQIAKFLPLAENLEIIGTYAQTEMGHGNVNLITIISLLYALCVL